MQLCWNAKPVRRPDFSDLAAELAISSLPMGESLQLQCKQVLAQRDWEIPRARLRLLQNVHSGHFHTVKLFELQPADGGAKWRRVCGRTSLARSARLFEVETLVRKHLDHPNVIPVVGLCGTMLIEEWMVS